jgi:hypothetical protein
MPVIIPVSQSHFRYMLLMKVPVLSDNYPSKFYQMAGTQYIPAWYNWRTQYFITIPVFTFWAVIKSLDSIKLLQTRAWILSRQLPYRGRTKCRGSLRQRRQFLPYSVIFILYTVHYYFDTWIQMLTKSCINHYFSLSCLRKRILKKYV